MKTFIIIPREDPGSAFILQGTEKQVDDYLINHFNEDQDEDDLIESLDELPDSMAVEIVESKVLELGKKPVKKP